MSRSTAHTVKPASSSRRVCRPLPAAKSSTRPPGRISGKNLFTQAEGGKEASEILRLITIFADNCARRICRCTTAGQEVVSMILFTLRCAHGHDHVVHSQISRQRPFTAAQIIADAGDLRDLQATAAQSNDQFRRPHE